MPAPEEKAPEPEIDIEKKKQHKYISTIVMIQARIRRFLMIVRRKAVDHFGEVCKTFYMRYNEYRFKINIYKVEVAHTIKKKRTQHVKESIRHRDETNMHAVKETQEVVGMEETRKMVIMYHVLVECVSHEALGSAEILLNRVEFPQEFPFLIDYFRQALSFSIVKSKGRNFKVIFNKLTWSHEQEIIHFIRQMIMDINNKAAYNNLSIGEINHSDDLIGDISIAESYSARFEEFDYDKVRSQLRDYKKDGIDIEALRLKIQHEARQIIERQQFQNTEVRKIVSRERRKERDEDWRDYIRINDITKSRPSSHIIVSKPSIYSIVKAQSLIRGWLARRNKPKAPKWVFLFDFVVSKGENYYLVRIFRAPDRLFDELQHPYLLVASRYMCPKDTW